MILSHKIKLKPNKSQARYFAQAAGVARHAFNWGLGRWRELREQGEKASAYSLKKEYNALKRDQFPWALDVTKCAPEQAFANLGKAFSNFFRNLKNGAAKGKRKGYPRFKKKGKSRDSFYIANDKFQLAGKSIRIPKLGWVKMAEVLRFEGKIMGATVGRTGNHWFVSVQVEIEGDEGVWNGLEPVGVDVGIKELMSLSDGLIAENQRNLSDSLKRMRQVNQKLSRQVKGSKNWWKTIKKLRALHAKIANRRKDYLHKWTSYIASHYGIVGVETLNILGMAQNRKLARHIMDCGWGEIYRQLDYKQRLYGCRVVKVGRWFASSKACSSCGWKNEALTLSDRQFDCQNCEQVIDRDLNAALNIKSEALRLAYP